MNELPPEPPMNAQLLQAFLVGRDVPCPRYGYNLRDASGDVCAECGTAVRLGVYPTEPVMRAWIAAVVAASLGAGIGLLFLALVSGRSGMPPSDLWWIMFTSWAYIPTAVAVVLGRRGFLRLAITVQWGIAAALSAVVVAMFAGLMAIR